MPSEYGGERYGECCRATLQCLVNGCKSISWNTLLMEVLTRRMRTGILVPNDGVVRVSEKRRGRMAWPVPPPRLQSPPNKLYAVSCYGCNSYSQAIRLRSTLALSALSAYQERYPTYRQRSRRLFHISPVSRKYGPSHILAGSSCENTSRSWTRRNSLSACAC